MKVSFLRWSINAVSLQQHRCPSSIFSIDGVAVAENCRKSVKNVSVHHKIRKSKSGRPSYVKLYLGGTNMENHSSGDGYDTGDGFLDNPDTAGVQVDGFPLPPIPKRADDDVLLERLQSFPFTELMEWRPVNKTSTLSRQRALRVLIAGGGLGGLAAASALLRRGFDVHLLEQAKVYKPFGGPIQIQSNALWALREIAPEIYESVAQCGVQTGDRLSGIKDGVRFEEDPNEGWLVKFDAATPALKNGLPLTLAINRVALQEIFLKYGVPPERIHVNHRVVSYDAELPSQGDNGSGVCVTLEDGRMIYGDILIGADGIWSSIRHQMCRLPPREIGLKFSSKHANYCGYTCYTGTCRHTPKDIADVAYKVFLGQQQYFGCTDCGHGWQHWWAFLSDPPPSSDNIQQRRDLATCQESGDSMLKLLRRKFDEWHPDIQDLFEATNPDVVRKRPIFDRPPMWKGWVDSTGRVALLGDACHPTLPNLGQGGAMAIEDAYALAEELDGIKDLKELPTRLIAYQNRRFVRASIAQFLSRNGSDLLKDWDLLRSTPILGPFMLWVINLAQPLSMNYLYSARF